MRFNNYADYILNYLCEDITNNCFEHSSEQRDDLYYTKRLVQKYSKICQPNTLRIFESKISHYIPNNQKEELKQHYKSFENNTENQEKNNNKNHTEYYPMWGHFQYEIIKSIDSQKISNETSNLLMVLNRSLSKSYMPYVHFHDSYSGSVISPVDNKEISAKAWVKIILNNKIGKKGKSRWSNDKKCF